MHTSNQTAARLTVDGEIGAGRVGFTLSPLRLGLAAEVRNFIRRGSPAADLKARSG